MTFDPFADEQTHEAQEAAETNQWDGPTSATSSTASPGVEVRRVRVTLKGGTAYDAPWITIDGADVPDALEQLTEHAADVKALIDQVAKVGRYFASTGNGGTGGSNRPSGGGEQAQGKPSHQEAPSGEKRFCEHGEMPYRSGVSKNGNTYKGFFCSEADRSKQCKPQFVK
ncbi:MAG: hypothetical protein ABIQ18_27860 [Umezawaea sp.]